MIAHSIRCSKTLPSLITQALSHIHGGAIVGNQGFGGNNTFHGKTPTQKPTNAAITRPTDYFSAAETTTFIIETH